MKTTTSKATKKIAAMAATLAKLATECEALRYEDGLSEADVAALRAALAVLVKAKHDVARCTVPVPSRGDDVRARHAAMMAG